MFVADGDAECFVEWAFLVGAGRLNTACNVSKTLSDLPDLLCVEWGFLLSGDGGECVELRLRCFLVSLCVVDPLGDDGWVGSGFEGCLVAGESSLAVLDRLACLSPLGCMRFCCACCGACEGERFDGGGEPVGGEGPGDPRVQGVADDVFAQVDGVGVGEVGVQGLFLVFEFAAVVDVVADGGGIASCARTGCT
ncbi:hypothetical protein RKE30_26750 [Streptomyces sp. Li-HN-5-11]|uniref:hypothetical protein n=1 Tax=Streptomyces sp. Li-HN-5-11 TaxID=3075432 RepID=UPI0028A9FF26|nr:hypothetical protein [Streptomyces sp. Li-HN-5-11]WNM33725.1 hypothetical protein RKE30_26750 [Streptomyces sp. Li-HN-5-11]